MAEGSRFPFGWPISPESIARDTARWEQDLAEAEAARGPEDPVALTARSRLGRAYPFGRPRR
jgi:hypothetical protein